MKKTLLSLHSDIKVGELPITCTCTAKLRYNGLINTGPTK